MRDKGRLKEMWWIDEPEEKRVVSGLQ